MSTDADASSHAYNDAILRQLVHEDGLLVNRLSWLVASPEWFLFTAYAIMLNGSPPARNAVFRKRGRTNCSESFRRSGLPRVD